MVILLCMLLGLTYPNKIYFNLNIFFLLLQLGTMCHQFSHVCICVKHSTKCKKKMKKKMEENKNSTCFIEIEKGKVFSFIKFYFVVVALATAVVSLLLLVITQSYACVTYIITLNLTFSYYKTYYKMPMTQWTHWNTRQIILSCLPACLCLHNPPNKCQHVIYGKYNSPVHFDYTITKKDTLKKKKKQNTHTHTKL